MTRHRGLERIDVNGRERIRAILRGTPVDRVGFWLGNPWELTKQAYARELGVTYVEPSAPLEGDHTVLAAAAVRKAKADADLALVLGSDLFWWSPEHDPAAWRHPDGKPIFDCYGGRQRESLGQPGILATCKDPGELDEIEWPDPVHFDFSTTLAVLDSIHERGMAVASGMWAPFFHVLCDFFGMENYFVKMHTHPEVVAAATERLLGFYVEANRRFLDAAGGAVDVLFFGNDLGSQDNLLISPAAFEEFVYPGIERLVEQAKEYGLAVMLHSCGAVGKVIPRFLAAGVDALHPLQAKAAGMAAHELAERFRGQVAFVGGVDTQVLLPERGPDEVSCEVRRLIELFGPRFVVSPSHEALLPHVPLENVLAMRNAARDA